MFLVIDNDVKKQLICAKKFNTFSTQPVLVEKELKVQFDTSDMTWMIFVSQPTLFVCSRLPNTL